MYNGRDGVVTDENGLLYMRARYYSPELKRFINADIIKGNITNNEVLNQYAYANGNPVSNIDPFGLSAERNQKLPNPETGDSEFFQKIGNGIKYGWKQTKNFISNTFGAGATVVDNRNIIEPQEHIMPFVNMLVTAKTGSYSSTTLKSYGDSSKPISVYAVGRNDNWLMSSAGVKINIKDFTFNISLGLDDIGFHGSVKNGDVTEKFGLKVDGSHFKAGLEGSVSTAITKNSSVIQYTNASITGQAIIAVALIMAGAPELVPALG